eukprot:scaffold57054_cov72-Phaeocystis_antarctica.AAC.1
MASVAEVKEGLLCSSLTVGLASIHAMGSSPRLGSVPLVMSLEVRSCREWKPPLSFSALDLRRRTRASHAAEVLGVCRLTSYTSIGAHESKKPAVESRSIAALLYNLARHRTCGALTMPPRTTSSQSHFPLR